MWAVSACGGDVSTGPGNVDGGSELVDGSTPQGGTTNCRLSLSFVPLPAVPGIEAESGVELDDLSLDLDSLRVIGDTTGIDNEDTSKAEVGFEWSGESSPQSVCFSRAPAGRYQEVRFQVDAYRLRGQLPSPDGRAFEIDDEPENMQVAVRLNPASVLEDDGRVTIVVTIDLARLLGELESSSESLEGDPVEVDEEDSESGVLDALRNEVERMFSSG